MMESFLAGMRAGLWALGALLVVLVALGILASLLTVVTRDSQRSKQRDG